MTTVKNMIFFSDILIKLVNSELLLIGSNLKIEHEWYFR